MQKRAGRIDEEAAPDGGTAQQHGNPHISAIRKGHLRAPLFITQPDFRFDHKAAFGCAARIFHPPLAVKRHVAATRLHPLIIGRYIKAHPGASRLVIGLDILSMQ